MDQNQKIDPKNSLSIDEIIDKDILELMGAKDMPEEQKESIYQKMLETIELRVIARVEDGLSDEEISQARILIENNEKEKFLELLKNKEINTDKLFAEEALIYKIEMIDLINKTEE